ncbi:MAG: hypothetical protein WBN70_17400 [Polyangiales bacterium]
MTSIPAPAWEVAPAIVPALATNELRELGRGRSGVVYVSHESEGFPVARKVFGSSGITKLVQCILLGAPNPYVWNEDAIRCAHLRREILAKLVECWFEEDLFVARSRGWSWNHEARAFELRTQLVDGRAPDLRHPLRGRDQDHGHTLNAVILPKLQRLLIESGFDGMVWQAGKGNPVAFNNFLLEASEEGARPRWAWIDLESGVPALAALSPVALLCFYLPRSFRFGRPLFDDVDADKLRAYVNAHDLRRELIDQVEELDFRQKRWKTLPRPARSVGYREARGDLSEEEAAWYRERPLRWYLREAVRSIRRIPGSLGRRARRTLQRIAALRWRLAPASVGRFLWSQQHRARLARIYTEQRIDTWVERRQMSSADASFLRTHLDQEDSATFATDFCVHIAIKPFVKAVEYWVCPILYALGFLTEGGLALAMLTAGPIARSIYTGGRIVQNSLRRKERPWTALCVGTLPVIGNFAFPIQFLRSSRAEDDDLARFLLYDGFARIGAGIPIWGGEDTLTEHKLNRMADYIVGRRNA